MPKTFLYQGLARSLTATSPAFSAPLVAIADADPAPVKIRRRTPWTEPQTFVNAAAIPLPDPRQVMRYPTAEPLPVRIRTFHAEHIPVTSRDGMTLPTLPAPQRAYVEMTVPNPPARRFRVEMQEAATGWPVYTLPMPVQPYGGADPNPMTFRRVGACHAPESSFLSKDALPIPTMIYSVNEVPPRRLPFVAAEVLSASPWFQTTLFPAAVFSPSHQPFSPKRPLHLDAVTLVRDFAAPLFCWSQINEPLPRARTRVADGVTEFAGVPDKSPPFFGRAMPDPVPPRRRQTVTDAPSASVIVTTNEQTFPGAWSFDLLPPVRMRLAAPPWLMEPADIVIVVGPTLAACRFISLTGADNTSIRLDGDGSSPRTISLAGVDNTSISLDGEC